MMHEQSNISICSTKQKDILNIFHFAMNSVFSEVSCGHCWKFSYVNID